MATYRETGAMASESQITLGVLNAVSSRPSATQRSIASDLGIALGLANSYLKRCAKKGFIKVTQAPANRYAYYLTPRGFAEKSRLTAEYFRQSFSLFRQARHDYREIFSGCLKANWQAVALIGLGDLCEIALLCAQEVGLPLRGILDPGGSAGPALGLPVLGRLSDFDPLDAVVLTDMRDPQGLYEAIACEFPRARILVPLLLEVAVMPREGDAL